MKKVLYAWLVMVGFFVLTSCSQWLYTEEGEVSRVSNFQILRNTVITFDGEKFQYDSLYLFYQDSLSQANGYAIFQFGKMGRSKRDALDMFVDIYGCTDMYCSNANTIVFHDSKYEKINAVKKDDFSITKPEISLRHGEEFGQECELKVSEFFDLKIDLPDVLVDWTLQEAGETCEVTIYY